MFKGIRKALALTALPLVLGATGAMAQEATLAKEAKEATAKIYFERCAGCHGVRARLVRILNRKLRRSWVKIAW